jgi:hypothetical protein
MPACPGLQPHAVWDLIEIAVRLWNKNCRIVSERPLTESSA